MYKYFTGSKWLFTSSHPKIYACFETDPHISNVKSPILILHDANDNVVPDFLGQQVKDV